MGDWRPIETAPKGVPLLVAYRNKLGNWRRVRAQFFEPETLALDETAWDLDDGEWAPPGWYELSETHETIMTTDEPPELWHHLPPLPEPPQ